MENIDKLEEAMLNSQALHASEHVLLPLIEAKIQARLNQACSKFTGGEKDFVADIAYIQGMKEIKSSLLKIREKSNQTNYELNKDQM